MKTLAPVDIEEKKRQAIYRDTINRISKAWDNISPALPSCLKKSNPALNEELDAVLDQLDAVWRNARLGMSTESEFKMALLDWERKNYEAITSLEHKRAIR